MGLEPLTPGFERQYYITSTIQPIDTKSPHHRSIYRHMDFSIAFLRNRGRFWVLGLGGFFTHWGILSYCIEKPAVEWGPGEIAILLLSSFIERFPKKCCQRSTVQAVPILFHQVIDRLPRYVMLQYFWIWKSLLLLTFWTFWSLLEHCVVEKRRGQGF